MSSLRSIFSVILGYTLFTVPSFAFFKISGQAPHQQAPLAVMVGAVIVGIVSAFLGGYVAGWLWPNGVNKRRPFAHGAAVCAVISMGAAVSLISAAAGAAIWFQLSALCLMAPSAALGGRICERKQGRA